MGRLFGTNGVRGVANKELTVEMIARLAATVGAFLGREIAIGRDGRTTSPMFRDATISGLLSVGCNVHDAGMLPTPALQHAVKHNGLDGGIMITASHNPPEFNGIKVIASDGVEIPREHEAEIEETYFGEGPEPSPWDTIGSIGTLQVLEAYNEAVKSHVDAAAIREAGLKIAIDPGNGVAALTAPEIARDLGCNVYTVNVNVNGRFPGRDSEPRPDNLDCLKRLVRASGADLGIAFDGDGDRSMFVDEKGEIQWGDRSVALLAKDFMAKNPGERVVSAVNSSKVLDDVVTAAGGSVVRTKVGSVVISRVMVDQGIMFGGEENGGIMYGPHLQVRDGSMAMALMLEIMAKAKKPLSELFDELPRYHQLKDRVPCPEELKERALEALRGSVDAPEVGTIDGVKLGYEDGSWVLFRPSGTEPVFRIYAEAGSPERVVELVDEHKALIASVIESLG
jgi:phosphomannomutase/phosphoglucomutase